MRLYRTVYKCVLIDEFYIGQNTKINRVVYYQLEVAAVGGTVNHFIKKYEDNKDIFFVGGLAEIIWRMKQQIPWGPNWKATALYQRPIMHSKSITFKQYFGSWKQFFENIFRESVPYLYFLMGSRTPIFIWQWKSKIISAIIIL